MEPFADMTSNRPKAPDHTTRRQPGDRRSGPTVNYPGLEPHLLYLDETKTNLAVAGKFVKIEKVTSEEKIVEGQGLVPDGSELEKTSSALFVLELKNHRLIYMKRSDGAPNTRAFRTTIERFINKKRDEFIEERYSYYLDPANIDDAVAFIKNFIEVYGDEEFSVRRGVTKVMLAEWYPRADLEVFHLSSDGSVDEFIQKFSAIKELEITVVDTNDMLDISPLIPRIRDRKNKLGSRKTTIRDTADVTLSKEQVTNEIKPIAKDGNSSFSVVGTDKTGGDLRGSDADFSYKMPIGELSGSVEKDAPIVYSHYLRKVTEGVLSEARELGIGLTDKIARVAKKYGVF